MSPIKEAIEAQPEALWLATKIEEVHRGHWCNTLEMNAATELRRQHAEIAQLTAALAALRSMPAEPVAWAIFTDAGNARMWTTFQPHVQKLADAEGLTVTPLYTTPQAPKAEPVLLSDAEIQAIWSAKDTPLQQSALTPFGMDRIRAVEAEVIRRGGGQS